MKITKRASRAVGVLMTCIVGLVVGVAAPAQAAVGDKEYWSQLPIVQQGRYPNSNLVRFWQRIVWADVSTNQTCSTFVDGAFGSNTTAKTRTWQDIYDVEIDGSAGPQTWSRAQSNLRLNSSSVSDQRQHGTGLVKTYLYYYYVGKRSSFYLSFVRGEYWLNGYYQYPVNEPWEFHNCNGYWTPVTW